MKLKQDHTIVSVKLKRVDTKVLDTEQRRAFALNMVWGGAKYNCAPPIANLETSSPAKRLWKLL